jgi:magnesium transporter
MEVERLLTDAFAEAHPGDVAALLERLDPGEAARQIEDLPAAPAAAVLARMTAFAGARCLGELDPSRAGEVLDALPRDLAAGLLRRLDAPLRRRLLEAVPGEAAVPLARLLQYPEDTAGALMDPQVLALPDDIAVGEAQARVQRASRYVFYYVYVVERTQALVGVVTLRELMLARAELPLASVMRPHVARLPAGAARAAIVVHPGWRQYHALPVVDEAGVFLGAVRYETLRRLEEDVAAAGQGPGALDTALTLAELAWVGLAGAFGGVTTGGSGPRREAPPHGRAADAR